MQADKYRNNTQYIKKLDLLGLTVSGKFLHGRVLYIFKMAILDFLRRLQTRSKTPTRYIIIIINNNRQGISND